MPKHYTKGKTANDIDSIGLKTDSVPRDTFVGNRLNTTVDSALTAGPDTTLMDSLELAIYHHNKAIDDSLALDSINRKRKNGIDSPVEYEA